MISVLIPNYNNKDYLKKAIESALAQEDVECEIIVADGASTDGSVEVLKSFGKKVHWISEPDTGQSDALLKAFALSKGDTIGWLNSDETYATSRSLQRAQDEFDRAAQNVAVIYGDFQFIDHDGTVLLKKESMPYDYKKMVRGRFIPNQPSVFFRRAALLTAGFVSTQFDWCMDLELYARLGQQFNFLYVPFCFGNFRLHAQSKTGEGSYARKKFFAERRRIQRVYDNCMAGTISAYYYEIRNAIAKATKYRKVFRFVAGGK